MSTKEGPAALFFIRPPVFWAPGQVLFHSAAPAVSCAGTSHPATPTGEPCMNRTILFAAAGLAALSSIAAADVNNFCRVSISPNISGGSGPYDHFVTQPGTIDLMGSATGGA